jgi:hypothetical protein
MRLKPIPSYGWRLAGGIGCVAAGAFCCARLPLPVAGIAETTNSSIWACVTAAALALVYLNKSN